jgi:hypothetical protein
MTRITQWLQPQLSLLDDGLALYRRHFVRFVLIAAAWFVPIAIATGLLIAGASWLQEWQVALLVLGAALVSMPLVVYLVGGLSRAAIAAAEGNVVRVREALAIPPRRAVSMGCFTVIYSLIMQVVSSALSFLCICPLWVFGVASVGVLGSAAGEGAVGSAALLLLSLIFGGVYLFAFVVGGASYSSLIYAIQPWIQEPLPFGKALERSFQLIGYRFWNNLAVWCVTAALVTAGGLVVAAAVGVFVPLPILFVLGAESSLAQAVAAVAWMIGLVLVIPPLPIWMALQYRRNLLARNGDDFEVRVQKWAQPSGGSGAQPPREHPTQIH